MGECEMSPERTATQLTGYNPSKATGTKDHLYMWLYVLAIAVAETVTAYFSPMHGIICHAALLVALLSHASLNFRRDINKLYQALALAPLIRIMSLAMPLTGVAPIYWYLVISLPLFAAGVSVMRQSGLGVHDVNLAPGFLPAHLLVALIGVPLGYVEYLILRPEPLAAGLSPELTWFPALVLLISTGFLEEFIFRGVMYRAAVDNLGKWYGIFYISTIFALLHITHRSPLDLVFVFGVAMIFSLIVSSSRSILGVSLAHGLTNIGLYLVWPFLLK